MSRYRQLADETEKLIADGTLRAGDRLASIRQACRIHRISPITVSQAYLLQVMNISDAPQVFSVAVEGSRELEIVGPKTVTAAPGSIAPLQVTVSAAAGSLPAGTHPVTFRVFSPQENTMQTRENSTYRMP